jgi:hypothetical protein
MMECTVFWDEVAGFYSRQRQEILPYSIASRRQRGEAEHTFPRLRIVEL